MLYCFRERMGFLLGLDFFDTNHSEEKPCVHLYHFMKLGTTEIEPIQKQQVNCANEKFAIVFQGYIPGCRCRRACVRLGHGIYS